MNIWREDLLKFSTNTEQSRLILFQSKLMWWFGVPLEHTCAVLLPKPLPAFVCTFERIFIVFLYYNTCRKMLIKFKCESSNTAAVGAIAIGEEEVITLVHSIWARKGPDPIPSANGTLNVLCNKAIFIWSEKRF